MNAFSRCAAAILLCCFVPIAPASTLFLSTHSSDETPASILDATLEFSVIGNVLTLEITNDTADPYEYDINAVYFNVLDSSNVTGLTLTSPSGSGWTLAPDQRGDGFGNFDYSLMGGVGNNPDQIFPGMTETFVFDISGTAPFFDTDFTSALSTIPPGRTHAVAAAKFAEGPGDDSAFGAMVTTPEPATLVLLVLGNLVVMRCRRR